MYILIIIPILLHVKWAIVLDQHLVSLFSIFIYFLFTNYLINLIKKQEKIKFKVITKQIERCC